MTALLYILKKREILLDVGESRSHSKRMLSKLPMLNAEEEIPNFTAQRQLEENVRDKELNYATHAPDNGVPEAEGEQLKHDDAGNGNECERSLRTILYWSRQQNENS